MKKLSVMGMVIIVIAFMSTIAMADGESNALLSADYDNTFVIKSDGSLWGWGGSYSGNGTGHRDPVIEPVKILENVKSVSSNVHSTMALKKDGTLWVWGYFSGTLAGKQNPTFLEPALVFEDVMMAANGDDYMLVVKNDGSLWLCGNMVLGNGTDEKAVSSEGFVQVMTDVKTCFAGEDTVYVVKTNNSLWGWGDNSHGTLGNLTTGGDNNTDVEYSATFILEDVKYVAQSGRTVLAIRLDGSLYSWGTGSDGIYTEGGWIENAGSPYKVMNGVTDVTMTNNGSQVFVVKIDGSLWGWGSDMTTGASHKMPYKIADNVKYVSAGERHLAVIKTDNTLWTMGGNYRYGLGYDIKATWYTPLKKIMSNLQDIPANWAMEEVEKAIGQQLIPVELQNNYTKSITREEFCVLAIVLIEKKSGMGIEDYIALRGLVMAGQNTFEDTQNPDILAAKTLGITEGTSATTFSPNNQLTREQAAKFLSATARAVGKDITALAPSYADIDSIASWAKPYTGYVYNINVMKGVGGNRFDPRGGYQRQQAFMTMYRLFDFIEVVSLEKVDGGTQEKLVQEAADLSKIKADLALLRKPDTFTVRIEGDSVDVGRDASFDLAYDVYYKYANVRIDTYTYDRNISSSYYNEQLDSTDTHFKNFTNYIEHYEGNMLPIRLIDVAMLEQLEIDTEFEFFSARYEMLHGERVLYIESTVKNGVNTKIWYSLKYLIPIQFKQVWVEQGETSYINWEVVSIDEETPISDTEFLIPTGDEDTE